MISNSEFRRYGGEIKARQVCTDPIRWTSVVTIWVDHKAITASGTAETRKEATKIAKASLVF